MKEDGRTDGWTDGWTDEKGGRFRFLVYIK